MNFLNSEYRSLFCLILLCSLALLFPHSAGAKSAFALALPDYGARDGVAYAFWGNRATTQEAEAGALRDCQATAKNEMLKSLCKIVGYYDNRCLAVAWDPEVGTTGFGWNVSDYQQPARDQALQMCQQTAGDRAASCVVSDTDCDRSAP